ncbi:hypothetical protein [Paractinoplanes atraurantiacus]|uniref:hypothetical protein n=1 Tax=Paractinoplanes atraurantiacus TaxID=1036182 RepID=UPI000BE31EAB|nr:hypothetical protein [Actinoplanes atraurantiacus]
MSSGDVGELALARLLGAARRVRVYDRRGPIALARKRRDRVDSPLLVDVTDAASVAALGVRPDTEVMDWMEHPGLWFVFDGADGRLGARPAAVGSARRRSARHARGVRSALSVWGVEASAQ